MVHCARFLRVFLLLVVACLAGRPAFAATHSVQVIGEDPDGPFLFAPSALSIAYGDTVRWVWVSGLHTTTQAAGACLSDTSALWDGFLDETTTLFSYVFVLPDIAPAESTYFYECIFHCTQGMNGTITVSNPTGVPLPPPVHGQAPFFRLNWGELKGRALRDRIAPAEGQER
jgi:plastocyanin